ncbi:MAG: deoxyribodipyrimidine photo-lyase [Congregibacter sp.]
MSKPIILWFRQDLRLNDLPSLQAALRESNELIPVFIFDDAAAGEWAPGGASRWWLHHSLASLAADIGKRGGKLLLRRGDTATVLRDLCRESGATTIHCSRRYEPWAASQEHTLHLNLSDNGMSLKRFPGSLLHEPGRVLTLGGAPFKVFTPFWRACQKQEVPAPAPAPKKQQSWSATLESERLDDWQLLPSKPDWARGWEHMWSPGEDGAQRRLEKFLDESVGSYTSERDLPAIDATSRLSPHLHHGELSPRQVWAVSEQRKNANPEHSASIAKFQAELGWREFSYHLLHFFPEIPQKPFKAQFTHFPWQPDAQQLMRWQQGQTGYPIVDAGMRELWQTGYMHNRVRMVVASFLCKHLLQHWRAGEDWFWDTLLDADLASNSCSWQWVAGSGADAAPYFRIFNPVLQGEKFDKKGVYVRRWVPELSALPDKYLHKPWEAPGEVLSAAGISLGDTYPEPQVDHKQARQSALDAYTAIKQAS